MAEVAVEAEEAAEEVEGWIPVGRPCFATHYTSDHCCMAHAS